MEENGDNYVHKMDSFVNTRVNRSIGKSPKIVKNSDFFVNFFYNNPIIEHKKPFSTL